MVNTKLFIIDSIDSNKSNEYFVYTQKNNHIISAFLKFFYYLDINITSKLEPDLFTYIINNLYVSYFLNINVKVINVNLMNFFPSILSLVVTDKDLLTERYTQFNIKYLNEIILFFMLNFYCKNIKNICIYIKKNLDKTHFKDHKKFYLFYFDLLDKYIWKNQKDLDIKGIHFVLRGKLDRGGNSRKKAIFFYKGSHSNSNKMLKLNKYKWSVWTDTGAIGCKMSVFY